ncbi:type 2 lanthipeptide synthetase LanM [Spirosoma sordidisoli]|uniref:Type 2 lantipeptide synthetase LanM n=1 Tax=Spirosoma sordidisoli TaxID=2502893 RepID=A0A4Q2UD42_9BACT|nr:type 2 lanthipeptide synthetase LanM [Spirosoma sordidisoli]RYC66997.1 type 2 lantipeptide synthetase LanM [Spirosoma sordidisoli]
MNNQNKYLSENELEEIPFIHIILPYTENFLQEIEKNRVSAELIKKLNLTLLRELSAIAEVTLQEELTIFVNNGFIHYQDFVKKTSLILESKYPVLDNILKTLAKNYSTYINNIFSNFYKDFSLIVDHFFITLDKSKAVITDIDTNLGDGHSGESTALITLADDSKLIYKPRNIDTTNSYNFFIDWVNKKLKTNLKTFKSLSFESYGWLEYITNDEVNTSEELHEYYHKAGILLAVAFLLGSKDCHYENIIASGQNPVIIDHETIVQPFLSKQSIRTWDDQHKVAPFSVLESMLIANQNTGVPSEYTGYGIKGNCEAMDFEKKVINPNTISAKRVTRFVFRKLIKNNIPIQNNCFVFASDHKKYFIEGFSAAYDMFMNSKEQLLSSESPILRFNDQKVRYVWRPTFVYSKILNYMRGPVFMTSFEVYKSKLYELMSKAYKGKNLETYKVILECEIKQLLSGDIPLFHLNSSDLHFEEDKALKIFKYNCIENIKYRASLLSTYHKKEQLEYITQWLSA